MGIMGSAMTGRLVAAGHRVVAFDIDPAASERAAALGCQLQSDPSSVAAESEIIIISLPRPEHVIDTVQGDRGLLRFPRTGSVIVDTSTVDPGTSRSNAAAAATRGVGYVDAPVLGRPARVGRWTMPVGGELGHVATAEPVLLTLAERVVHVGPPGSGNTIKLLNNLMFNAINGVTAEVFALAERVGVAPAAFFDIVVDSGAGTVSNLFRDVGPRMASGDFDPVFSVDNLEKDAGLGLAMAAEAGLRLEIGEAGQRLNQRAQAAGLGDQDTAATVKAVDTVSDAPGA
jgi:3-hydroxyisobutyrate dehydrogenase-like beta-hydroxyacid dehydrogenase